MLEALGAWLVFGAFGYWALLVLAVICLFGFTKDENFNGIVITIALYALYLQLFAKVNIIASVNENRLASILFVGLYFAFGFLWSLTKWSLLLRKISLNFNKHRLFYVRIKQAGIREDLHSLYKYKSYSDLPEIERKKLDGIEGYKSWQDVPKAVRDEIRENYLEAPSVSENREKIANWIISWPTSLLIFLFSDFLTEVSRWIVDKLKGMYEKLTIMMLRDDAKDDA